MNSEKARELMSAEKPLTLVGHHTVKAYELWVWADEDGQGYVTKDMAGRAPFGWKLLAPNWTAESFLKNNKCVARINAGE